MKIRKGLCSIIDFVIPVFLSMIIMTTIMYFFAPRRNTVLVEATIIGHEYQPKEKGFIFSQSEFNTIVVYKNIKSAVNSKELYSTLKEGSNVKLQLNTYTNWKGTITKQELALPEK